MASPNPPRILVVDDQPDILEALRLLLKTEGLRADVATSPAAALDLVARQEYGAALVDLNYARDTTSGQEGLDLLASLREVDALLPVVVMTAWGTVDIAVEAMRRGARDFIGKPWDNERLLHALRTQMELRNARAHEKVLEEENRLLRGKGVPDIVGNSPGMAGVLDLVRRVGPSDANILLTGENGTGKSLLARFIHHLSERSARPLVSVNVGGLSEGLFEAELFGHVKGAFTDAHADRVGRFEMAAGGTLFLDEIANLTPALQAKLLRVLESGEFERVGSSRTLAVDVRILSATNADLPAEVAAGRFRQDLLFRLNTIEVRIPPLRERPEDIPVLAGHFLEKYRVKYRKPLTGFGPEASQTLLGYAWPGNIRELEHVVERAVLLSRGTLVQPADLSCQPRQGTGTPAEDMSLEDLERLFVARVLARREGNVVRAARDLGLSRSALYRRLAKYGLKVADQAGE